MESMLGRNAHISDAEIAEDLAETEREIAEMKREAEFFESTPETARDYRWNNMRAEHRRTGIAERESFVANLKELQRQRLAAKEQSQ